MKKLSTLVVLMMTLLVASAFAQGDSENLGVSTTVVANLTLAAGDTLVFGQVPSSSTPIIDPTSIAGHTDVLSGETVGTMTLDGAVGASVDVTFTTATLIDGGAGDDITFTPNVYGDATTTHASATQILNGGDITLSGGGEYNFWIGGALGTLSSQLAGAYTGTWSMTVDYN